MTTTNLLDRLELARDGGEGIAADEIRQAAEWWLSRYGTTTIDFVPDGRIAGYAMRGSYLYIWLADSGEWHAMIEYAQSPLQIYCLASPDDEESIETLLDEFGIE